MIGFRSDKNMKVLIIKSWTIFSKKTRFDQSEEVLLLQQFITSPRVVVNVFLIVVAIIITILPTVSHMSAACHYNSTLSPTDPHQPTSIAYHHDAITISAFSQFDFLLLASTGPNLGYVRISAAFPRLGQIWNENDDNELLSKRLVLTHGVSNHITLNDWRDFYFEFFA